MIYITVKKLDVHVANARPAHWVVSAAPVMPAFLMGHALGRRLAHIQGSDLLPNSQSGGLYPTGVHLIYHGGQYLTDYGKYGTGPQKRRAAASSNMPNKTGKKKEQVGLVSDQPHVNANIKVSLVFEYDDEVGDQIEISDVKTALTPMRLAGGYILKHGDIKKTYSLMDALQQIGSGYLLVDRTDLVDKNHPFESALDAIYSNRKPDDVKSMSWLSLTCLGYHLAEQPKQREGVRFDLPHAYGEALVGLVQYRSLKNYLKQEEDTPACWSASWHDQSTFVVSQHQAQTNIG